LLQYNVNPHALSFVGTPAPDGVELNSDEELLQRFAFVIPEADGSISTEAKLPT